MREGIRFSSARRGSDNGDDGKNVGWLRGGGVTLPRFAICRL